MQARLADDPMASHEHRCFVEHTGLAPDDIVCHDLCGGPPSRRKLAGYDAIMVGGAGDFHVSKGNLPNFAATLDFLREIVETGFPMFASCFGYQCIVAASGGEITYDPENTEVGTYEISVTDEGAEDSLFKILPRRLNAQMGHKDRATRHPSGYHNLAISEQSKLQAFRVPNQPIWATQFHPELNRKTNLERFRHYLDGYAGVMSAQERQARFDRFQESPETGELLPRFLSLVFDWPARRG